LEVCKSLDAWRRKPDVRLSGVCFGHQLLCRALGSKVESTPGDKWELSHTRIDLAPLGERLFEKKGHIHLHQMHQDHVVNPPSRRTSPLLASVPDGDEVEVWGSSETTPVQGVYLRERLFTTQGHLGYDEGMVRKHVQHRLEKGLVDDEEQAAEAKESAGWEHDGVLVAGAILRFFGGEDKDVK
jgi:GMP synthase-like glutamine amidotransferase